VSAADTHFGASCGMVSKKGGRRLSVIKKCGIVVLFRSVSCKKIQDPKRFRRLYIF